uniref:Uncharacterized protein n=1 Tax=Setaria viridis TaxID=4556 RepID=A0A4U6WE03_SETVI|nr:hypothetical protein SEVIR_1G239450v2 [Setaria viridis]
MCKHRHNIPGRGCGNLSLYLSVASLKTLMLCTEPGQPARTNVNLKSKSQTASTFCVVKFFRQRCCTTLLFGTTTGI